MPGRILPGDDRARAPARRRGEARSDRESNAPISLHALRFEDVWKSYPQVDGRELHALRGVTARVEAGARVAIIGRSGSGKSTFLHLAAGIDEPSRGEISILGSRLTDLSDRKRTLQRREKIGLVFQFFHLLPHLGVLDNVVLPALIAGDRRIAYEPRARELLGRVGLQDRAGETVEKLSGGEMQRVAICRAMLRRPCSLRAERARRGPRRRLGAVDPDPQPKRARGLRGEHTRRQRGGRLLDPGTDAHPSRNALPARARRPGGGGGVAPLPRRRRTGRRGADLPRGPGRRSLRPGAESLEGDTRQHREPALESRLGSRLSGAGRPTGLEGRRLLRGDERYAARRASGGSPGRLPPPGASKSRPRTSA